MVMSREYFFKLSLFGVFGPPKWPQGCDGHKFHHLDSSYPTDALKNIVTRRRLKCKIVNERVQFIDLSDPKKIQYPIV